MIALLPVKAVGILLVLLSVLVKESMCVQLPQELLLAGYQKEIVLKLMVLNLVNGFILKQPVLALDICTRIMFLMIMKIYLMPVQLK